jgi:hypothetical protein
MPAIKLHPTRLLKWYKGYKIVEERSFNSKGVITKTNICVFGKKKYGVKMERLQDKFKNTAAAVAYAETQRNLKIK